MEPEGSLSCSQDHASGSYPESLVSSLHHTFYSFNIYFNIIFPSLNHFALDGLEMFAFLRIY